MTIVLSILLAAIVGGIVFMLLDGWQRKRVTPAVAAPPTDSPIWTPEARAPAYAPPPRPTWMPPEAETRPLPQPPVWTPEAETQPIPRPLWTPPPAGAHWDDDRGDDDAPPGLWSGWARR